MGAISDQNDKNKRNLCASCCLYLLFICVNGVIFSRDMDIETDIDNNLVKVGAARLIEITTIYKQEPLQ